MHRSFCHIALLEPSRIIAEGIQAILSQSDREFHVLKVESLDDLLEILESRNLDVVIVNPIQFVNREKEIKKIKRTFPNITLVGIEFGTVEKHLMAMLDYTISLYDSTEDIVSVLCKHDIKNDAQSDKIDDLSNLTDREVDVLTKLVKGLSNKEIAESLNISIHTVITHRKNITIKTGIRSQSGLTIYAIYKKIIRMDDFSSIQ